MSAYNIGDRITHAKRGKGEIRALYPPIRSYGKAIPMYGVRFPKAPRLILCTEPELKPAH